MADFDLSSLINLFTGAGALGSDIYGFTQNLQNQQAQRQVAQQLMTPEKLAAFTNKLYQPLQGEALNQVTRDLQGNLGLRGLTSGFGPYGAGYGNQFAANALARIEFDRQQAAQRQAMQALGGVSQALPPYQPTNQLGQFTQGLSALRQLQNLYRGQAGIGDVPTTLQASTAAPEAMGYAGDFGSLGGMDLSGI